MMDSLFVILSLKTFSVGPRLFTCNVYFQYVTFFCVCAHINCRISKHSDANGIDCIYKNSENFQKQLTCQQSKVHIVLKQMRFANGKSSRGAS